MIQAPDLRASLAGLSGRAIWPGDAEYDAARHVFVGGIDRRPAVIVRSSGAADVAAVVRLARTTGLELAVRSGGHSSAGHGVSEGGIVLDLREMKRLDVDVQGRTAWAETGLTAAALSTDLGAHQLAVGFGDTGSVGIGGITLGGGIGYLVRRFGLTVDSLLAAEIVTADGELRRIDADDDPDLFWAIRGGGGNFGVATRFRYRLQPLDGIVGGMLLLPANPETVAEFIALSEAAPEELTTIANVMNCPPMPFVAPEHHGKIVILAFMCFAGPADTGERALEPFRALAVPLADLVKPMPYHEIYPPEDPDYHPLAENVTMFVDRIDRPTAQTIDRYLRDSDSPMRVTQIRALGGAMARVANDATAFAHRKSRIMVNVATFYEGPEDRPRRKAWVEALARELRQSDGGAYVGFLADEGDARIRAAYPGATWERLRAIKQRYDPTNLFRLNQNVPPA